MLEAVPRHHFIPDIGTVGPVMNDPASWIDRAEAPDGWWRAVDGDVAIGVQLDDGAVDMGAKTAVAPSAVPTSSASAPSLVAEMLELLDARTGDHVLEIGTGTGWSAALLARRAGQDNVTTIEVDADLAAQAAANLRAAGFAVGVLTADGALGWKAGAPYDRVHVTAGVCSVPYAWVEQTRPDGVIVLPWMPGWVSGHLLRLTVAGEQAIGRLHGGCGFMMMRDQRAPITPLDGRERESTTSFDPLLIRSGGDGLAVAVAGLMPGVTGSYADNSIDGSHRVAARAGDSHALVVHRPDTGRTVVTQQGPRNLWDELEAAYRRWDRWGRPETNRYGVTVSRDGLHLWLDRADNSLRTA